MARVMGAGGEIRAGYMVAASLGKWILTTVGDAGENSYSLSARIHDPDAYLLKHGGALSLRLHIGSKVWEWEGVQTRFEGKREHEYRAFLKMKGRQVEWERNAAGHSSARE